MAKHSYNSLQKKYQGFIVPTHNVLINKSDKLCQDPSLHISMIQVELTAGYEASACTLLIEDGMVVNEKKKSWEVNQTIQDLLKLGHPLEVSLGYSQEVTEVFKGIITNIQIEYSLNQGFQFYVEAMDVKRLMMNNYHSCQPRKDLKKHSDAVKEILKKYAKHIDAQVVSDTEERTLAIEQHNQSDYDFLVTLAKRVNHAFYIINNQLYFEPYGKDSNPLVELQAEHLHAFKREISLSDQLYEVTVRANDESDPKKSFEYTTQSCKTIGKGKKSSNDIATMMKQIAKKTIIDPSISSVKEAKVRAEAELFKHTIKFAQGKFQTIGLPEITPGKMMTVKGFGADYDNDYYIKKVLHQYDQRGFITKGELGVNKI
ncbi:phage late control D family protein [Heliorestis acidaminivorans]|uniref:Phage late control D family protein n=1 Tax=Heliorestis acidaminivorans TaxID=553427 RepID=A0A6I0ESR0_9FIRM|nr:phage late control D family protein [Heliorestis acidaminivorans]KAB2951951.1 phage late control D family protein [Heliorestis acidaminivorans]